MSNNPAETLNTEQPEQPVKDALLNLVRVEIPSELQRIKRMKEPSVGNVHAELHGTLGSLMKVLGGYVLEIRDWVGEMHSIQADHIEALGSRVDLIEEFGGDTSILPGDAELLAKIIFACKHLASEMIKGAVPDRDEEGKQKLAEIILLCEQGDKLVNESVLSFDDEDLSEPEPEPSESGGVSEPN
jgi:hypothetical protein